ncbi:Tpr-related protein family member, putative [Theileria annulata]|uniref:Tpr-related protein family member, putative n=1 Tax=Theileria annulata TaxID=5874 RepID=Q4UIJ6_THEAN|nr:Tpr-related protein family member, putative [Theileria annulata]CAI73093.1 Tpr-related protein family member, putative [Theileria annulata]|eukprot:XP_953771.1 Tpr-related protein family member, putative [Theileria annulata]
MSHKCSAKQAGVGVADCELLIISYIFAGLAMMLNIRLSYSSAPYALIRFKLPENLFSVFVRRIASALELWCLPSMLLGNIIDLIQKLAVNTDGDLKASAGTGPTDHEKLRGLAKTLHDKAEELNNAVTGGSEDAAKVLRHKAGTEAQKSDTKYLRKLAKELHEKATRLENQAPEGTDNPSLKQKAGSTPDDGLRQLAAELYKATKELSNTGADDQGKAGELATAVGDSETSEGIRAKLKNLATGTGDAEDVTGAYGTVESAFGQVQQQEQQGKYTTGDKQEKYQAVKTAWEAFKTLYTTNLKQLANGLKVTVGNESDSDKLQKTLADLGNHQGAEAPTTEATKVKTAYSTSGGDGVKDKFTDLQAKGPSYQAIAAIKPLYEAVVSAMNAFDNVYRPEELLKDEVGDGANENKGLQQKLKELYTDGHDTEKLPGLAKAVRNAYSEGWGPTVKSRFESVMAQEKAYAQGNTIKTTEYKGLLEAWTNFNDKYYGVISYYKYYSIVVPSVITQWLNFLTYVILFVVYVAGGDSGHLTIFYLVIAISGFVFGINMTLVYSVDWNYIPIYIAGENCFPIITSFIHYITTIMFGNRRKWNSDFIVVCVDIVVAIIISFVAAVIWTAAYLSKPKYASSPETGASWYHHIFTHGFSGGYNPEVISPFLMIVVGMGLVYAIYPGIAPGMIVPFYLIDKIEMVLLIMTIFPPVIVATLRRSFAFGDPRSPMCQWKEKAGYPWNPSADLGNGSFWHAFDLLMIIKIVLAGIFIYSLHYRESNLARSIINQPKMSTFLSITFYMCHECLLALGFPGLVGANNGGDYVLIPQYIGALFMIFLAFYSEGYIIEYKSHDPAHWPTEGMWYLYGYYQLNLDFLL